MKTKSIHYYLIIIVTSLSVIPLIASYFLLDDILNLSLNLSLNGDTKALIHEYQKDLKTLKTIDPDNEPLYKSRFNQSSSLLDLYNSPNLIREILKETFLSYYYLLFSIVLIITLILSILLSRKIASSYNALLKESIKKEQRLNELNFFDQWQVITSSLAHEVNNPLTPIEMMVSHLPSAYKTCDSEQFQTLLEDTKKVVTDETQKLKEMVRHFNKFSKLPAPQLIKKDFNDYISQFVQLHKNAWPNCSLVFETILNKESVEVLFDHLLLNQCFMNIINNALQSNPNRDITIIFGLQIETKGRVKLSIENNGIQVNKELLPKIFQLNVSSKSSNDNMGLGLSIVRKIILDHSGDIRCRNTLTGVSFIIELPTL